MLGDTDRPVANIADRDSSRAAGAQIDVVVAGRGDRDQVKFGAGVDGGGIHCYPIGDRIVALPDREMISASLV